MRKHVHQNRTIWNADADAYQTRNAAQLEARPLCWGVWAIPESQLRVLGEVRCAHVLELGCGGGQWSQFLAERGARAVGLDLSERQLRHARMRAAQHPQLGLRFVHGDAEQLPFAAGAFDLVFCDHGAMSFCDPRRTVPEVARVLRPGGSFAFNVSSPLRDLCWNDAQDALAEGPQRDYFSMHRLEDDEGVCFQLSYGAWIELFVGAGFAVERLLELQPPADATTTYEGYAPLRWARRLPAENIWKLRRVREALRSRAHG